MSKGSNPDKGPDSSGFFGSGFFEWQLAGNRPETDEYRYNEKKYWGGFPPRGKALDESFPDWAIGPFAKHGGNPVFSPQPGAWDSGRFGGGVHNGAVVKRDGWIYYVYRGEFPIPDDELCATRKVDGIDYLCDIGIARSRDGIAFERVAGPLFRDGGDEVYSFEDVCVAEAGGRYFMFLNRWDWLHHDDPSISGVFLAVSDDLIHWEKRGLLFPGAKRIHRNPCVLQDGDNRAVRDGNGRFVMYINDGLIAFSDDLLNWKSEEVERSWPGGEGCFALSPGNPERPEDIVLFTGGHHTGHFYAVGEVLFSLKDPASPLDWLAFPVLVASPEIPHENGLAANPPHSPVSPFRDTVFFTGMTEVGDSWYAYYGGSEFYTCLAKAERRRTMRKTDGRISMERLGVVLGPEGSKPFTEAKYNAGMVLDGDTVHMAYRYSVWRTWFDPSRQSNYAIDQSRYAKLTPDGKLIEDTGRVLLAPSGPLDASGCQDPRIVAFEGWYYLFFCSWDKDLAPAGKDKARVGVARTKDFATVERLGVIDHYTWDKDAYIFPERIGGKVAYVHRVEPNVQIDYFDSIEAMLDPVFWKGYASLVESSTVLRAAFPWENGKVGGSVPPIRTGAGWLFLYHAVEPDATRRNGFVYRAGAALLDIANPSRVVARLPYPILEPEEAYELYGDVDSVVFPVGGYVWKGDLYVSYGCADRSVAIARIGLSELLDELAKHPVK